jgi:hypothetical protein
MVFRLGKHQLDVSTNHDWDVESSRFWRVRPFSVSMAVSVVETAQTGASARPSWFGACRETTSPFGPAERQVAFAVGKVTKNLQYLMSIWKGLLKTFKTRAAQVYAPQKAQGLPKNAKHSAVTSHVWNPELVQCFFWEWNHGCRYPMLILEPDNKITSRKMHDSYQLLPMRKALNILWKTPGAQHRFL